MAFERTHVGNFSVFSLSYDVQMGDGDFGGADGHSFILLNTANFGTSGALTANFIEEAPNLAGSFGVGFDTFNSGAVDGNAQQSVSLHFNGSQVANVALPNVPNLLESGQFNTVELKITPGVGGSLVDLTIIDHSGNVIPIYTAEFISGLNPYEARLAFAGRTGGANHLTLIDNITANFNAVPEPTTMGLLGLAGLAMLKRRRRQVA